TPKSGETKDGLGNARVPEFNSLFRQRHAKPVSTFSLEPSRTLHCAVAISVGLHHGHHGHIRAYTLFDGMKIRGQCVRIDFGPGRAVTEVKRLEFRGKRH